MIARTLASAAARTGSAMATAAAPASRSFASGSGTPGFTIALCQIMVGDVRTRCSSPAGCCVRSYCHDGSLWICTMIRTSPPTLPPHGKRSPQLLVKPTAPKWLCCLSALTRLTQPGGEAHARLVASAVMRVVVTSSAAPVSPSMQRRCPHQVPISMQTHTLPRRCCHKPRRRTQCGSLEVLLCCVVMWRHFLRRELIGLP